MQAKIQALLDQNYLKKDISKILGIGYSTVRKYSQGMLSKPVLKSHYCRDCGENDATQFYGNMKQRCKKCHNRAGYIASKEKMLEYAASRGPIACTRCGYNKSFAALDWHHRDPNIKDPQWNKGWNYERLKTELDKCDLVCSNCHRELHHGDGGLTLTRTGT